MKQAYLSRAANLRRAIAELDEGGMKVVRVSPFYRTEPVDYRPQPWFVNCVAEIETDFLPLRLLNAIQKIERKLGRRRKLPKGPRPIDLDILFYDNAVIRSAILCRTLVWPRGDLFLFRFTTSPQIFDIRQPAGQWSKC